MASTTNDCSPLFEGLTPSNESAAIYLASLERPHIWGGTVLFTDKNGEVQQRHLTAMTKGYSIQSAAEKMEMSIHVENGTRIRVVKLFLIRVD